MALMDKRNTDMVDWQSASQLAAKITPVGPRLSRDDALDVVEGLRQAAQDAVEPILETTRMRPAPELPQNSFGQVFVVDRARWAEVNLKMLSQVSAPAFSEAAEVLPVNPTTKLGAAAEVAAMMAVLAPRVLGQFDPYTDLTTVTPAQSSPVDRHTATEPALAGAAERSLTEGERHMTNRQGQLLLVAPNVAQVERELQVDPEDFRLWVCLHEQTHGLQFAAAPWLAPYMYSAIQGLLSSMVERTTSAAQGNLWQKFLNVLTMARDVFNGVVNPESGGPLETLLGPEQRVAFETISATMALLEGHADVMMDEVGPELIPTVAEIREKFEKRRDGVGQNKAGVLLRRAMGMDAKMAQYRDGAVFVRGVEELVGRDGLNAIWQSAANLPKPAEIADPQLWVHRVHG
jgi:coenzyme F420 biosynthesis associated uncharacterized protein